MVAIRRAKFTPNRNRVLCKDHFKTEDYVEKTGYGTAPLYRLLKKNAVPSIFRWTIDSTPTKRNRDVRAKQRAELKFCEPNIEHVGFLLIVILQKILLELVK